MQNLGEFYALLTTLLWAFTSILLEIISKKFGSLLVNLLRLFLAFLWFSVVNILIKGFWFSPQATIENWTWLILSALVGFLLGDFSLIKSFETIGARVSQLIMTIAPIIAAFFSWLLLKEKLSFSSIIAILLTLLGIVIVLFKKNNNGEFKLNYPKKSLFYAFLGALGQGLGIVFSKIGMKDIDAFSAAQIRVFTGFIGFSIILVFQKKIFLIKKVFTNKKESILLIIGSLTGPFFGVFLSLLAIKYTNPAIAQTIMATVPIMIIPFSHYIMKEKIKITDILGAILSVIGVSLFFIF